MPARNTSGYVWRVACAVAAIAAGLMTIPARAQGLPLNSLSFASGYTFERANLTGTPHNLNGWYASVNYSIDPWLTMQGQFTNYFGSQRGSPVVSETFAVGPTFSAKLAHSIKPLAYVLMGEQRSQNSGSVNHQFELQLGGGIQFPLAHNVDLKIVPFEYDLTESSGTSTYVNSIGLVIKFPKRKK